MADDIELPPSDGMTDQEMKEALAKYSRLVVVKRRQEDDRRATASAAEKFGGKAK